MRSFKARRGLVACAVSAASIAALAAPGVASAKKVAPATCAGSNITLAGSTLQKLAVKTYWGPAFASVTNKNPAGCGEKASVHPTIGYESIGSGAGLEKFGYKGHAFEAGAVAIATTDEPVNASQKAEIETNEKVSEAESVQSIPVIQAAVAILVHLPTGCTATSTAAPGVSHRQPDAPENLGGEINKWTELKEGGNIFTGGAACEAPFARLVSLDESGTTHILKRYLNLINGSPIETASHGELTWAEMSEEENNNEAWPTAASVKAAKATGGGALVKEGVETSETASPTPALRTPAQTGASAKPLGGPGTEKFWAEIQNSGEKQKSEKYADPATNGDEEKLGNSNCTKTKYTNGKGTKFPPETTASTWNEVTTSTKEKNYPICGVSYQTVFKKYSNYPGTTLGEEETAAQFVNFELNEELEGGQQLIVNTDYEPLGKKLDKEAKAGLATVGF